MADIKSYGMYTGEGNRAVDDVLTSFAVAIREAVRSMAANRKNMMVGHPEAADTAVREFVGLALEDMLDDFIVPAVAEAWGIDGGSFLAGYKGRRF